LRTPVVRGLRVFLCSLLAPKGDTGSTIIVPKDGESFADTVKRATDRVKQNPEQVEKEIADESTPKNLATKTAEALGGAAAIGFGGHRRQPFSVFAVRTTLTRLFAIPEWPPRHKSLMP
jgi:hypothetical protein